jgi:hypothetical protein
MGWNLFTGVNVSLLVVSMEEPFDESFIPFRKIGSFL